MVPEHAGDVSDFQVLCIRKEVGIEFNVVFGEFTHLAGTHANDSVVGVQLLPSPSIERELKVFKQALHVTHAYVFRLWACDGFEVSDNDQALRWTSLFMKRMRGVVVLLREDSAFGQSFPQVIG